MKMSISEIADRYSICRLKRERANEENLRELNSFAQELNNYDGIWEFVNKLYDINGEIWNLESDIRKGREGELGLEEVGRRAIEIRNWNKKRIYIKNKIVEIYKEGVMEKKVNHGSD